MIAHGDSKLSRLAAFVLGEPVRTSRSDISLKFAVPCLPVVLNEPGAKHRELFRCELFDLAFE